MLSSVTSQTYGISYQTREANARYIFQSNTTSIRVHAVNDTLTNSLLATPGGFHALGLVVDGVNYSAGFQLGGAAGDIGAAKDIVLSGWSAGTHTFEIVDGPRYILTGTKRGTPLLTFTLDSGATFTLTAPSAPSKRLIVYGDSFSSAQVITNSGLCGPYVGWPMLMRANVLASGLGSWAGAHVINDSLAGWKLDDMANDAATIPAFTAQCDGTVANGAIHFLGVNDYLQSVPGATFSNDLAVLLDAEHAAVAGAQLYVCRIPEFNNTANGAGLTPHGYNLLIDTVCSTRAAFVTTIDLSSTLTLVTDYASDNVHPNSTGMPKLEAAIRAALGY